MKNNQWVYVKRASASEKAEMQASIEAENEFQQQEPHGEQDPETLDDMPITYKLEFHDGWQMTAYKPNGEYMDSSYSESFARCGNCGQVFGISGDEIFCYHCFAKLTDYAY